MMKQNLSEKNLQPIIELCQPKNYQAVADIYNEHIVQHNCTMDLATKTADDIARWVKDFNTRERLYVVKKASRVIGWGIIKKYSSRMGYQRTCETAIYFRTTAIGKGYGTMLKKFLMQICKTLDYHHIVGKIWATNRASIEYNRKLGFTIVGTQKEIGYVDGKWIDVVIMQYVFDK